MRGFIDKNTSKSGPLCGMAVVRKDLLHQLKGGENVPSYLDNVTLG
jgi:predicted ATP-dependent Lon-type protease